MVVCTLAGCCLCHVTTECYSCTFKELLKRHWVLGLLQELLLPNRYRTMQQILESAAQTTALDPVICHTIQCVLVVLVGVGNNCPPFIPPLASGVCQQVG